MFGYIDEIKNEHNFIKDANAFKLIFSGDFIWVTNYIKILEYSEESVVLKIKNNAIKITGAKINIKMFEKKELILCGEFNSVVLDKPYKG